ncbi:hypothetical protein Lesp02_23370 [Lentzea sp. NBRC 105346]|uniref:hypothetical protein n=1 Tax=Lentzea sp. NBRC 105346 TaxID=3032205 RepID=UPI00249FDD5F|nr:hypothetical protein [Lentzea sp. NBRC 105346]GLZ30147.1 hypothetical protein Lesp02_23370 [Lentzea sp. NBRC 105346]
MTRRLMQSPAAQALHRLQQGPAAYHCPGGHGVLRVWPDAESPTGLRLACTGCGHGVTADTKLVELATSDQATVEMAPEVRLADGTAPEGLRPDGTVRATAGVQLGNMPVSSGVWAALAALSAAVPLAAAAPALPVVAPPLAYLLWKLCTRRLPASQAVNTQRTPAAELTTGQQIRLYGTAGPVGEVSAVGADAMGRIRLRMVGGMELLRKPGQQVWQVELRT